MTLNGSSASGPRWLLEAVISSGVILVADLCVFKDPAARYFLAFWSLLKMLRHGYGCLRNRREITSAIKKGLFSNFFFNTWGSAVIDCSRIWAVYLVRWTSSAGLLLWSSATLWNLPPVQGDPGPVAPVLAAERGHFHCWAVLVQRQMQRIFWQSKSDREFVFWWMFSEEQGCMEGYCF